MLLHEYPVSAAKYDECHHDGQRRSQCSFKFFFSCLHPSLFTLCFLLCQVGRDYKVLGDILEETEPELIRTAGQIDEQALSKIIPFTKAYFLW